MIRNENHEKEKEKEKEKGAFPMGDFPGARQDSSYRSFTSCTVSQITSPEISRLRGLSLSIVSCTVWWEDVVCSRSRCR